MSATPTGFMSRSDDSYCLAWQRTFRAPIDDVWDAITESDRLGRWIGTWTGDPADGFVMFTMTAEGEDVPEARFEIPECDRPQRLRVEAVDDFAAIENTGPGWDYYPAQRDHYVALAETIDPGIRARLDVAGEQGHQ